MPDIGIILGSGLNTFAAELEKTETIFRDDDSFHKMKVVKGRFSGRDLIIFTGRRHFYEGYTREEILKLINIAKENDVKTLIITNAAGGINKAMNVSDLMLITSHVQLLNKILISGIPVKIYKRNFIDRINSLSAANNILLRNGTYGWTSGPMYETTAEIKFLKKIKIDAIGMSTIPEMLFANSIGIKTICLSVITNLLNEVPFGVTDHSEVVEAGKKAYIDFFNFMKMIVNNYESIYDN